MRLFVAKFSLPELEQLSPNRWRPEPRYVSGGSPLKTRTWRHRKKSGRSECHFAIKKLAINANGKRAKSNFSFMGSTVCYGFRHIKEDGQYSMCRWGRKVTQSRTGLPTPQVHLPRVCTHSEVRLVFLLDSQLEKSRPRIKNFLPI